jgi:hypothetical protein
MTPSTEQRDADLLANARFKAGDNVVCPDGYQCRVETTKVKDGKLCCAVVGTDCKRSFDAVESDLTPWVDPLVAANEAAEHARAKKAEKKAEAKK